MLRTGALLHGTYRIDDYLSSGGFGNTYVATHVNFNEKYAIKEFFMKGVSERDANNTTVSVSNNEKVDEFHEQLEKFKKEARRLRRLNNPHIVRVHDLFEENGTAYYVMDYINGENLKDRLKRTGKPMREAEVESVLRQALDALREVHSQGIWHLDLKPANVMIDREGTVKLIDFGASKQINNKTGGALSTSAVTFTNGYAPIEQMEKSYEKFGPWTDFYALGATLYNLLANQRPPMPSDINDDPSPDKHLALPMPSGVSARMRNLVLWLMRTNRLERPDSVQAIQAYLDGNTGAGDKSDDVTIVEQNDENNVRQTKQSSPAREETAPQSNSEPSKSKKGLIIGIISALVIAAGVYWALGNNSSPVGPDEEMVDTTAVVEEIVNTVSGVRVSIPLGTCTYTGEVNADGVPDGHGTAVFSNGDKCEGSFVNGDITGDDITYQFSDGDKFVGSFQNNGFYKGRYTTAADGRYFEGTFKDNMPDKGQWYDKNGNKTN